MAIMLYAQLIGQTNASVSYPGNPASFSANGVMADRTHFPQPTTFPSIDDTARQSVGWAYPLTNNQTSSGQPFPTQTTANQAETNPPGANKTVPTGGYYAMPDGPAPNRAAYIEPIPSDRAASSTFATAGSLFLDSNVVRSSTVGSSSNSPINVASGTFNTHTAEPSASASEQVYGAEGINGPAESLLPESALMRPALVGSLLVESPSADSVLENESPMFTIPSPSDQTSIARPIRDRFWLRGERFRRMGNRLGSRRYGDDGIGTERVMFAPMSIDTATSTSNVGIRTRFDQGMNTPDRLEYIWAKAGRGPGPESKLNIIDNVLRSEIGNEQAVAISEITMRSLNPELNNNTVGFGDMVIGGKAILWSGSCSKVASIFRTYLKTGPIDRGLGTGHVSLEPGLLFRHQWNESTFIHGEVKYWLPIAGDQRFAGDVFKTGLGVSTIWRETDRTAWLPTFEVQTYSFLFGSETLANGSVRRVNGTTAVDLLPGMRVSIAETPIGLCEVGFAGGFTVSDRDWFDSRVILDLRWVH